MEIQQSTKYNLFKVITGNRVTNKKKIERIVSDINDGVNLLPYCPILVYKKDDLFFIVDGQHRHEVSKILKEPIYYIETSKLNLHQIAKLNSRSDKWSNSDFLNCYVNLGNKNYIELRDFIKKHGVVYSTAISLLMKGQVGKGGKDLEAFRNGEFTVNYLEESTELVILTSTLFDLYVFNKDRYLISAVHELKKAGKCDFSILKRKIKSAPNEMCKQVNTKDYKYNIEKVYNYNNQNRVSIF